MRKAQATLGTAAFLAAAPGVVAGLVPWVLTGWRQGDSLWPPLRVAGAALVGVGAAVLLLAFAQFAVEGLGTPAPSAPTERLVVGGLYRYVRNPMYLAVVAVIAGQALVLGRPVLQVYAAAVWAVVGAFVHWYEEPVLGRRFGARYDDYRRGVPAWRPRLRPWRPQDTWRGLAGNSAPSSEVHVMSRRRSEELRAMPSSSPPGSHVDLLERPLFAHLATVRPDGAPQCNVMWFEWNGQDVRFTHTTTRQKYRNFEHEPRVAFSVLDPDNPYRFIEVRGDVATIEADPGGTFYRRLQERYGQSYPVTDAAVRVVVTVRPTSFVAVTGGLPARSS